MDNEISKPEPKVFIIDDDPSARESLKWLVESIDLAVEMFAAPRDFIPRMGESVTGCAIIDLRMPGMNGIELLEKMRAEGITIPVIIISAFADVVTAVRAMKAGAVDFLEKPYSDQMLVDSVQDCIARDKVGMQPKIRVEDARAKANSLTRRQADVMGLVVSGDLNKEIARKLGISPRTVEKHRGQVMRKMSATSVAELVRMVARI